MSFQTLTLVVIAIAVFAIKYLNRTDVPKIKNLAEIPGVPIFGNLFQLGDEHARRAREWVKQYGGVFQVRMGNKVCKKYLNIWRLQRDWKLTAETLPRESYSRIPSIQLNISGSTTSQH